MASTYVAGGDLEYGRYGNPTWTAFEEALGALEGGRCLSFASGLAAVVDRARPGRQRRHRGGAAARLQRHRHAARRPGGARPAARAGWSTSPTPTRWSPPARTPRWSGSSRRPTRRSRSPTSRPSRAAAHDAGAYVVVDNTFATPLLQQPLTLGADLVVHSATKYLAGHSDVLLGAVVTRDDQLYDVLKGRRDLVGAIPGTLEAWLALRGLRTLHLRVERAQANAQELVRRLDGPPGGRARCATPASAAIVAIVLARGRDRRRPAHPQDPAVGARHHARRRRVDVRAPPPLEDRARHHPRGAGAAVGRHRGRRGPLGRPRAGPASLT